MPSAHLIHAGFSLPFCAPQQFPALWARIGRALAPGGVFAGQLFGTHDTWAGDPDMTFYARHQVEVLLDGLDIVRLEETERDGHAFTGPKHWHTFDILARKPISKRPSAPRPASTFSGVVDVLTRQMSALSAGQMTTLLR